MNGNLLQELQSRQRLNKSQTADIQKTKNHSVLNLLKVPQQMNRSTISQINRISLISMGNLEPTEQQKHDQENERAQRLLKLVVIVQKNFRRSRTRKLFKDLLRNFRYRRNVISELIMTEKAYVDDLNIIIHKILEPMLQDRLIQEQQHRIIASNFKSIRKLNGEFLGDLQGRFKDMQVGPYTKLGDITLKFVPFFRIYYEYYDNFTKSEQLIQSLKKNNKQFATFIQRMTKSKDYKFQDIESFMIKPIQRLPKYVLLIQDLVRKTPISHPDYLDLQKALKLYQTVAEQNNNNLDKGIRIFQLQNLFPQIMIADANRTYITEEIVQVLYKNKSRTATLYFLNNLILASKRGKQTQQKLIGAINLNQDSVAKDMPDTRTFENIITIIGENNSITLIESSAESKGQKIRYIDRLIDELKVKSFMKSQAFTANNLDLKKKINHQVEVTLIGTELRGSTSKYTVYITEIAIAQIQQRVYLRYSLILDIQERVKLSFPFMQISFMKQQSIWSSGNSAQEVEARTFQITSFLTTLLQSSEFRAGDKRLPILNLIGLPLNFYELPDLQVNQDGEPEAILVRSGSIQARLSIANRSGSSSNLSEFKSISMNDLDLGDSRNSRLSSSRYSATKLLRSSETSLEKTGVQKKEKEDKVQKQKTLMVTVYCFDQRKSKLQTNITQNTKTFDLMEYIGKELGLLDLFDYKLMIMDNDKSKSLRPLEEDEILSHVFDKPSIMDSFKSDVNEIYLRKYIYLDFTMEEQQLKHDLLKLDMVYNQFLHEVKGNIYQFTFKIITYLTAVYFYIQEITPTSKDFPHDKLKDIIPPIILKSTNKNLWQQDVLLHYQNIRASIKQENNLDVGVINTSKLVFIYTVYKNFLCGKQLFHVQCPKETQSLLRITLDTLYLGISVQGISIIDSKKKNLIKLIEQMTVKQLKVFPDKIVLIDMFERKYDFISTQGFQISQLFEDYQYILKCLYAKSGSKAQSYFK